MLMFNSNAAVCVFVQPFYISRELWGMSYKGSYFVELYDNLNIDMVSYYLMIEQL